MQEDDLKDEDQDTVTSTRWQNRIWVRQMFVWLPIVISVCFLVAGIILVIFFRGRVLTSHPPFPTLPNPDTVTPRPYQPQHTAIPSLSTAVCHARLLHLSVLLVC